MAALPHFSDIGAGTIYLPIEEAETLEKYASGGYHPAQLGDGFVSLPNGGFRYTIVHKLGFGGYATVWLARDEVEDRYVALKIKVASRNEDSEEDQILQQIQKQPHNEQGKSLVHLVLDSFVHNGPNGVHECLVSAPARCSLAESKFYSQGGWLFPLESARAITAQLIQAVAFLHSLGIAHGDLHMGNVLLALPDISSLTVEEIYSKYGEPLKVPTVRFDGQDITPNVPPYAMRGAWFGQVCENVSPADARILVTDFGESWHPASRERYYLNTPGLYRPPEALFAEGERRPIGLPADTWMLGCTIYALFAPRDIFECFVPDPNDVFAETISMLGKPPKIWWDRWEARDQFFDEKGEWDIKPNRVSDGVYDNLRNRLDSINEDREEDNITKEEMDDLDGLLGPMLRWLPEDRATLQEAAEGPWMKKWGLPALELAQSLDQ